MADPAADPLPVLVDRAVSAAKLGRQLAAWRRNGDHYQRRGWHLLTHDGLTVEVGFAARLPFGTAVVPAITACIRVTFENYDVWAPSVTFIDYFTREPAPPFLQAVTWENGERRNVLIGPHPKTGLAFLCLPGVREYHEHHEHSGDDWLLHRGRGAGTLAAICEEVWQRMVRNVVGVQAVVQQMLVAAPAPTPGPARMEAAHVQLVQENVDQLQEQLRQAVTTQPSGIFPTP